MKKLLLNLSLLIVGGITINAQTITDTVSTGSSYADQVWYNLEDGAETRISGTAWDFAFQINGFSAAILANSAYGAELYVYPLGDTSNWANLDTLNFSSWTASYNSASSWSQGAFNAGIDTSNFLDLGWGKYNFITHHVTGDSLFVWKNSAGAIYKIWIQNLASGTYNFIVSDLSGTNVDTVAIVKSNFANKRFAYYKVSTATTLDLEPADSTWHLVFSKYIEDLGIPYSVSGIRTNQGIQTVQVYPVNDPSTYADTSNKAFVNDINIIGHDWKTFLFSCFCYDITDSTVYFVKTDTSVWKLVMKGFGGSGNGNYIFEKTKLPLSTGQDEVTKLAVNVHIYPNPSKERQINLITDLEENISQVQLNVLTVNGQIVKQEFLNIQSTFQNHLIDLNGFESGLYFIQLNHKNGSITKRLFLN